MIPFPMLLLVAPFLVIGVLTICFGEKKEKRLGFVLLFLILAALVRYLMWRAQRGDLDSN